MFGQVNYIYRTKYNVIFALGPFAMVASGPALVINVAIRCNMRVDGTSDIRQTRNITTDTKYCKQNDHVQWTSRRYYYYHNFGRSSRLS